MTGTVPQCDRISSVFGDTEVWFLCVGKLIVHWLCTCTVVNLLNVFLQVTHLDETVKNLQEKLAESRNRELEKDTTNDALRNDLDNLNKMYNESKHEVEKCEDVIEQLTSELNSSQEELSMAQNRIQEAEENMKNLKDKVSDLQDEVRDFSFQAFP